MPADKGAKASMSFSTVVLVMIGGALGTLARYLISVLALPISGNLPWGTILINIAGSFVIGFFGTLTLASGRFPMSEPMRLFVMVGVCGGFTTFSSFAVHAVTESPWRSILYVLGTLIPAILAAALGKGLGERWIRARDGASA